MTVQYEMAAATSHARVRLLDLLRYIGRSVAARFLAVWRKLGEGHRRRRAERELGMLSDVVLKDIGVARSEIPGIARTRTVPFRDAGDGHA